VPNQGSPPAVLLRESYREGGQVKNRTVANLSSWPEAMVEALSRALTGLPAFTVITTSTPVQRQAFELLGVSCRIGYA
jgi:hypothetical protein